MTLVDTLWTLLVIFFMVMYFMVFFNVVIDLFRDHTIGGGQKALWVIVLIVLGPIGLLIYLIARGGGMAARQQKAVEAMQAEQKAYIQQAATGAVSPADQIATAKSLLDAGTISQSEFDSLKAKALA